LTTPRGRLFLYEDGRRRVAPGNVMRIREERFYAGDYDVLAVAKTHKGYRYTLKRLEDAE
jgi:hypothetical protein